MWDRGGRRERDTHHSTDRQHNAHTDGQRAIQDVLDEPDDEHEDEVDQEDTECDAGHLIPDTHKANYFGESGWLCTQARLWRKRYHDEKIKQRFRCIDVRAGFVEQIYHLKETHWRTGWARLGYGGLVDSRKVMGPGF